MTNDIARRMKNIRYAAKLHKRRRKPEIVCFNLTISCVLFASWRDCIRARDLLHRHGRYAVDFKEVRGPALSGLTAKEFRQFQKELSK